MPRIVVQQYDPEDFYSAGPLAAGIAHAGHDIAESIRKGQALDIEELRAKRQLQHELNVEKARQERENEREADRQMVAQEIERQGIKDAQEAAKEGMKAALARPEGILGPFGMMSPGAMARAFGGAQEIQQQTEADLAQAKGMSPAAGERFLKRRERERKQEVLEKGYALEGEVLQGALRDGKFENPFEVQNWKPGQPPSEQAAQVAQELSRDLQDGLRAGRPPGDIHDKIVKAYKDNAEKQRLYIAWEKADVEADEKLKTIRTMARNASQDIDPNTGKRLRAQLLERVADAESQWRMTNATTHREKTDPEKELAELDKILFGAAGMVDPEAFLAAREKEAAIREAERTVVPPTRPEVVQASKAMDPGSFAAARGQPVPPPNRPALPPRQSLPPPGGQWPTTPGAREAPKRAEPRPGTKRTDTGKRISDAEIEAQRPAREAERVKRGFTGRTAKQPEKGTVRRTPGEMRKVTSEKDAQELTGYVFDYAHQSLQTGIDRKAATVALLKRIKDELGYDPEDPKAFQVIREALVQAWGLPTAAARR